MKTTTDVLNEATKINYFAGLASERNDFERAEIERQDVLRIANGALESGAYQGQARDELKAAQYILSVTIPNTLNKSKYSNAFGVTFN